MNLFLMLGGAVVFAAVVIAVMARRSQLDAIYLELAGDPDVEPLPGRWTLMLRTRPPRRPAIAMAAGGGKNDPPRWDAQSQVRLAPPTTLSLSLEGLLGGLREAIGAADIHVGDEPFDRAFTVRGSDSAAVKSLLSTVEVRFAIETLFAHEVRWFRVDGGGIVTCAARRDGLSAGQPKRLLRALVALCDALEEASARSEPVPHPGA